MAAIRRATRTSVTVQYFGVLIVVAVIAAAAFSAIVLREREIDGWRRQMRSMSFVLAEQTSQTIFAAYLILDSVAEQVRQAGINDQPTFRATMSTRRTYEMLHDKIRGLPQVDVASIISNDGDNLNFSRSYPVPPINLAERDYFKAQVENPNLGDFISQPVRNKGNGKWTFYISRRLNDANGKFMGLVLVGMSVDVITNFFESVALNLGEGASISLYRDDFTLLTRWPRKDDVIGTLDQGEAVSLKGRAQNKWEGVTLRNTPRFSDGVAVQRLTAVRSAERYPLIVALEVTDELFLSAWRHSAAMIAGVSAICVLALLIGIVDLIRNLDQREADNQKMAKLTNEAESANRAKSNFLATMSHEIRTPMNGVLGMANLLLMPELTQAERIDYARTILTSGQHLLTLLDNILDVSAAEAGNLNIARSAFDPRLLVDEAVAQFAVPAQSKKLKFEGTWTGPHGQRYWADPIRLRQMLFNLVSNGIRFTETGFVRVVAAEAERKEDKAVLEFTVTDSGIGIPAAKQTLLFMPFSQTDSSATRRHGGTGLGLSIVRNLAVLMGGSVGVDSEAGKGSHFHFRIPVDILSHGGEYHHLRQDADAGRSAAAACV